MNIFALCSLLLITAAEPKMGTYTDEVNGFSIGIPTNWSVIRKAHRTKVLNMKAPDLDKTGANLNFSISNPSGAILDGTITLDDMADLNLTALRKSFPDCTITKKITEKFNGHKAFQLWMELTNKKIKLKIYQVQIFTPQHHYIIVFTCTSDSFNRYEPQFLAAAKAFKEIPKKKVEGLKK